MVDRRRRHVTREYPAGPMPSCHALVVREGSAEPEVLLVLRAAEPKQGHWALPGGTVELGETVEQALVREVAEEVGCLVEPRCLLGMMDLISRDPHDCIQFHFVLLHYLCTHVSGEIRAGSDASDARWVTLSGLAELPVTGGTYRALQLAGYQARRPCKDNQRGGSHT